MPNLHFVDLKLRRANEHIEELSKAILEWSNSKPIKTHIELRENSLGTRLVIDEIVQSESLDTFGLLLSECVHHLRSCLDNMVFALASLQSTPPIREKDIAFPIYDNQVSFRNYGIKCIKQLPADAAELVEKIQPFQRLNPSVEGTPADDPLVLLRDLSNNDKHKLPLVPILLPTQELNVFQGVKFFSEDDAIANIPPDVTITYGSILPGMVIVEYKTKNPVMSASGEFSLQASVVIKINNRYEPVEKVLRTLNWYTNLVIDQFRRFFPTS